MKMKQVVRHLRAEVRGRTVTSVFVIANDEWIDGRVHVPVIALDSDTTLVLPYFFKECEQAESFTANIHMYYVGRKIRDVCGYENDSQAGIRVLVAGREWAIPLFLVCPSGGRLEKWHYELMGHRATWPVVIEGSGRANELGPSAQTVFAGI